MTAFSRDVRLLPNVLSLARIAMVCVAAVIFSLGHPLAALAVGIPAGLTDYFDGYLARKRNEVTNLGAFLDLLADLLFTLVCLTIAQRAGVWPTYLLLLWGFRDLTITVLRASAGQQGQTIGSSMLGKVAANFNGYAFLFMGLDVARPFESPLVVDGVHWLGLFGIHAGILLQWIAGVRYFAGYARQYRG